MASQVHCSVSVVLVVVAVAAVVLLVAAVVIVGVAAATAAVVVVVEMACSRKQHLLRHFDLRGCSDSVMFSAMTMKLLNEKIDYKLLNQ